jgi:hypothetical protein
MEHALVDCDAIAGICGTDMVLKDSKRFVDVVGLAGNKSSLRIVTAQALISTHKGDAIATFHQMALLGKGKSILSCHRLKLMEQTSMTVRNYYLEANNAF